MRLLVLDQYFYFACRAVIIISKVMNTTACWNW
jgi:hypothetical protein